MSGKTNFVETMKSLLDKAHVFGDIYVFSLDYVQVTGIVNDMIYSKFQTPTLQQRVVAIL